MDAVIARYLPDFSAPPPPTATGADEPDFSGLWFRAPAPEPIPAPAAPPPAKPEPASKVETVTGSDVEPEIEPILPRAAAVARPVEDREALIAAAEARGREAGRAEALEQASAQAALERAAQQALFEEGLAQARRDWSEAQGKALAAAFATAMQALDAALSERVARLIAPVLGQALQRQTLDELAVALKRILAEPQRPAVRVRGPEDLIAVLSARLGSHAAGIAFEADAGPEVSVSADETVIETELAAWSRLIAAAVAEA
ncbi:Flagellar assembly protein FliH [Methylorubrum aminovorans]